MAKQKNIKIVYQVDTSQVKAAEGQVNKAKTATDNLKKSTKDLGTQSTQTGQQYKLTIRGLTDELNILKMKIQDTAITDKQRLDQLIPKYREVKAQVDALNKSIEGTAKSGAAVGVSLGSIYNSVRLALTAGLIKETADAVIQMTALAGKIEGVKRAFDKLPNSIVLMEELRQRTHGALTELELMQKALQARNFGIPIEQLGKLLEFAAIKSQQTGVSIQYLTDSIVTGLGRESIKILDNLQIDIGKLKKRMEETGRSMREVVGEIVNEELIKMGGYLETGETKVNRLKSAWADFGASVSKSLEASGAIQYLTELIKTADAFLESQRRGVGIKQVFIEKDAITKAVKDIERFKDVNKEILADRSKNLDFIQQEINKADQLAASNKINNMILKEMLKDEMDMSKRTAMMDQMAGRAAAIIETNAYIDVLKQYKQSLDITNELEEKEGLTLGGLAKMLDDATAKRKGMLASDRQGIKMINLEIEAIQRMIDKLNLLGATRDDVPLIQDSALDENGEVVDESVKTGTANFNKRKDLMSGLIELWDKQNAAKKKANQKAEKEDERSWKRIADLALGSAHNVLSMLNEFASKREDLTSDRIEKEKEALDTHYEDILARTGDNSRARQRVELEYEQKKKELEAQAEAEEIAAAERTRIREKKERLRQIAIDTAAGIVRAVAISPGGVKGWIQAGIIAGTAIAQAAIVSKFKDGVIDLKGPGSETSDSIPAMLSRRESVMTAAETKSSLGILKNIRARKLDDRIFEKLVVNGPAQQQTDFSPVIKAIEKNRPANIIREGSILYETKEIQKGLKKKIRRASFG